MGPGLPDASVDVAPIPGQSGKLSLGVPDGSSVGGSTSSGTSSVGRQSSQLSMSLDQESSEVSPGKLEGNPGVGSPDPSGEPCGGG